MTTLQPQKLNKIREDLLYEFVNLLDFLSDKNEISEEVYDQISKGMGSNLQRYEAGYNNLKRIVSTTFLRKNEIQVKVENPILIQFEFYETFGDKVVMKKKQAAILCEKSETWIHQNKSNFSKNGEPLYVKDFLRWLKDYDINYYNKFKENYGKSIN